MINGLNPSRKLQTNKGEQMCAQIDIIQPRVLEALPDKEGHL